MKQSARFCPGHFCLIGDICKGSVPVVAIKNVAAVLRNKQIREPVIIVITPDATKTIAGTRNTGFLSHIGKCSVSVVTVQRIANRNTMPVKVPSIDEINILVTVTVE